ncbi:gamma-glutamyl-gamma-aminobutyrate hydrolase family protein, partial [Escherichia coli]
YDLSLIQAALDRKMPVLGICRGMQLINVAFGGTLEQHLPEVVGHEGHRSVPGRFSEHEVRLKGGSLAARACGGERVRVKSHH